MIKGLKGDAADRQQSAPERPVVIADAPAAEHRFKLDPSFG